MLIKWHGHSCFEIRGDLIYVTDPHDGKSLGLPKPTGHAHIITISHRHFDHDKARLFKMSGTKVFDRPGKFRSKGVSITGIETFHDRVLGKERGKNTIFRVTMDGITMAHLGDIGHRLRSKTLELLGGIDIMFIPIGGVFTIDADTAWTVIEQVRPKVAVPMHYDLPGLALPIEGVEDFIALTPENCEVSRLANEVQVSSDSLEAFSGTETRIWVFSI